MSEKKMTPKQKRFCDYYIQGNEKGNLNASKAYIKAGYKVKDSVARANSSRLLTKANIKEYINIRLKEIESERIAKPREIMEFLTKVIRNEEKDQFGLDASLQDRLKAADSLIKRYPNIDTTYQINLERLKLDKARLALEIEKIKGNTGNNELASQVKNKMNSRKENE